jgi:hypothetical protein
MVWIGKKDSSFFQKGRKIHLDAVVEGMSGHANRGRSHDRGGREENQWDERVCVRSGVVEPWLPSGFVSPGMDSSLPNPLSPSMAWVLVRCSFK